MALATVLLDLVTQYDAWLIHPVDFGKMYAEHEEYLGWGTLILQSYPTFQVKTMISFQESVCLS